MASPNILALNLGTQSITLAEFQSSTQGGLVLARYQQGKILGDPNADTTRVAQSKMEVQQLAHEFGLKSGRVNYAIASHVIFTRPVHLPAVGDASQVEQIVGFEAAQNVPYPIDQVVWDWQLLDEGKSGQMEVILAAIKADLLDEINDSVQSAGLQTSVVDIAPMALYNAFRYNYPDIEGCTLIVDMGSRTTNLLFIEPGKIFPRRLNLGGAAITTAIAKDLNISFTEADARKVESGFVSLGGGYAEPEDPEVARISKVIRNQMTRLHQDIARSITFYRSEHSGSQPVRVLLAGGTASFPYMQEFFQEKLQMDVEFFNPLRNVSVSSDLDIDSVSRVAHTLGEVVGLALRSAVSCPMELNLRPASVIKAARASAQRPYLIMAGITALVAVAAWGVYFMQAARVTEEKTVALQQQINGLKPFDEKIKKATKSVEEELKLAEPLLKAVEERDYWVSAINDLNSHLPSEFIWVTAFELPTKEELDKLVPAEPEGAKPSKKKEPKVPIPVKIKGLYLASEADNANGAAVVNDFIAKLKDSAFFELPKSGEINLTQPNSETWAYEFSFPLYLKNPIRLK